VPTTFFVPTPPPPPSTLIEKCENILEVAAPAPAAPVAPLQAVPVESGYFTFANKREIAAPVLEEIKPVSSCQGWWSQENVNLQDATSPITQWYMDNCSI